MKKSLSILMALHIFAFSSQGIVLAGSSNLTAGMAKSKIIKNQTTQTELLEVFGAPNIVTKNKSGNEVWTYNQMSVDKSASDAYGTLLIVGASGAKSSASSRSFTLMIEFGENEIVKDFSYRSASF